MTANTDWCAQELPPRARRIPISMFANAGITGNYLRVRGEYLLQPLQFTVDTELPPRARRIPQNAIHDLGLTGTTSACAENTQSPSPIGERRWNYLRVRGEYPK